MNNNKHTAWKKGDLVYIPAETQLRKYCDDSDNSTKMSFKEYVVLQRPATVVVSTVKERYVEVIYQGARWAVSAQDTYSATNDQQ